MLLEIIIKILRYCDSIIYDLLSIRNIFYFRRSIYFFLIFANIFFDIFLLVGFNYYILIIYFLVREVLIIDDRKEMV